MATTSTKKRQETGSRLRFERERLGYSQQQIAQLLGVPLAVYVGAPLSLLTFAAAFCVRVFAHAIAALLPRSRRGAYAALAGWRFQCDLGIFATQKASVKSKSRWPLLFNRQGAALDPRAAKPVAERR